VSDQPIPASLAWAHPVVQEWFVSKFGTPTEPQEQGWPHILEGRTTLISAPTGSGKTLAAFLACIDTLVRQALDHELQDQTKVLYISPLKALSNDIQRNLEGPLAEILQLASERGLLRDVQQSLPGLSRRKNDAVIRTAVRTGDTLMYERRAMLVLPPHILVTTPESLYILLTADKSRQILKGIETVIVDEIHAVADDKRGAHLSLSLERLDELIRSTGRQVPARIGLSATQKPIEEVAHFLTGSQRPDPVIVNIGHRRRMDLAIEVPGIPLGPIATHEMWDEIYDRIAALVQQHRSTLIFVNTRKLAERIAFNLAERLGEEAVSAHHGSLSRKLRLEAEKKLKHGELKALVATASLELGIDVGFIDLVCHISSPRSIAAMLQRVGRAGHWRGATPKGRLFPTTRDELCECAALVHAMKNGELDRLAIPDAPLDILAQQIVALCAVEDWKEDLLYDLARRAHPYRNLSRRDFDDILVMLSDGIAAQRGRYGAYLHRDKVNGVLKARRGARLAAITSGGAIPESALYTVVAEPDGAVVGTLDEDFAVESTKGDIILLGTTSWRIRKIESSGRVVVENAHGAPPSVPFWLGEAPSRTMELSHAVAEVRKTVSGFIPKQVVEVSQQGVWSERFRRAPQVSAAKLWLESECGLGVSGAEQLIEYIVAGRIVLGEVPSQECIIAERFFDEGGGMQLIIHSPFGGRVNKAWGLALRKKFCRSFNFELQAAATDNGVNIALAEQHSFPLADVFEYLQPGTVREALEQAALGSPIFGTRWRWDASRALALLRFQGGRKVPPPIQRMRSDDLLASVFPDVAACQENVTFPIPMPDHPLIREVMKDVLHEAMDLDGLTRVIQGIQDGRIRTLAVDTPVPSVFSHEILNSNPYAFLDDAPLEERRARAVEMRRVLPQSVLEDAGALDPRAIAEVRSEAWPDVRDADELADALNTLIAVPAPLEKETALTPEATAPWSANAWTRQFENLQAQRRAAVAHVNGRDYWVPAEKWKTFLAAFPDARASQELPAVEQEEPSRSDAVFQMVRGWMMHTGPIATGQLAERLGQPAEDVEIALLRLEATGAILRGTFTAPITQSPDHPITQSEWCDRRLLARIHRKTVTELRKQVEPVTASQFLQWLLRWQHVAPGTQTHDERGTLDVLRQLQGFELPASAWEREVLAQRIRDYDPAWLDQLSLTGQVGWGRLSPHPATLEDSAEGRRRVVPTSVAPITFFVREQSDWMLPRHGEKADAPAEAGDAMRGLSIAAREVMAFLKTRGASFFTDIVRGTERLKAEVETALWELVAAGVVTADGFDNLRALINPKRRSGHGSGRSARPRHSSGRWSLLYTDTLAAKDREKAIAATCAMLLERWGVVFRELLARESLLEGSGLRWRDLLLMFRRLEDRGEVRGGRFVSGFTGEQFALPIAVDSLRALRREPSSGHTVTLSAADPLNLVGIIIPGERVPAISGKFVSYHDGVVIEEVRESMRIISSTNRP
jgi:ATP-dependent helicase Lhr and Lhr-like helicase